MAALALPDYMQRLADGIAKKNGFGKPRYSVSKGSQAGDNYLGVLYRVEVSDEDEAVATKLHLILKGMPVSAKRREEMRVVVFFDNEISMYRVVLPGLMRFLVDKGADGVNGVVGRSSFPYTPRCHEAAQGGPDGEDILVLEDMRSLGFTMHDRRKGLDEHHLRAVFKALAFLHATSFALETQRPDELAKARADIRETIFYEDNPMLVHLDSMSKRTYGYIKERFPEGSEGYKKLSGFLDKYSSEMCRLSDADEKGGNTISHGDCWTNNLLFKYSKSGSVEETCLLDFQLSRYAPPVLDLLYVSYCCTTREMRDKHLDGLLREYHGMLADNLRRLDCDAEELYPWATLQTQLRERGKYGLGMAVMTIPLFLADADEIPDLDAQFEKGAEMSGIFEIESKNAPERNKRICDVVQELIDRGWL